MYSFLDQLRFLYKKWNYINLHFYNYGCNCLYKALLLYKHQIFWIVYFLKLKINKEQVSKKIPRLGNKYTGNKVFKKANSHTFLCWSSVKYFSLLLQPSAEILSIFFFFCLDSRTQKAKKNNKKQEAHGPQLAHLSETATADMQMTCNIFPILLWQGNGLNSFWNILLTRLKCWNFQNVTSKTSHPQCLLPTFESTGISVQ